MESLIPGAEDEKKEIELCIEQVKAGDKQAYGTVIRRFEKPIYIYCYYLLKNREEAEDAAQEIFIKAYENIHLYRQQVSFSAWLYKIAYHHSINLMKKKQRWFRVFSEVKRQYTVDSPLPKESAIHELLELLTHEERHILILKAVEQCSFEEISGIMDLKPATVRKKYERLRKKLIQHKLDKGGVANGRYA